MQYLVRSVIRLLLCVPLVLCGCGEDQKSSDKNTLIMLTSADSPPFEFYRTGAGGNAEIVGFDIDLAKRIGEHLGLKIEVRDSDFAGLIPALQAGRADFAMAYLSPSKERSANVDFSTGYYSAVNVIVVRKDNDFTTREKFADQKLGVQLGSTQEQFARVWVQSKPGLEVVPLNKVGDIVQELIIGRFDAAIIEETPARAYVKKYADKLEIHPLQGKGTEYAIAFAKGSPLVGKFNQAIEHLKSSGYMDELAQKWLKKL